MARRDPVLIRGEKRGRPGRFLEMYYHRPGKRTWRTFKTKEAAEQFRLEVFKTKAADPHGETDYTVTLGDFATKLWLPQVKATVKRLSALRYEQTLRLHLLPAFKDTKLRLLTRDHVKRLLVSKLADGFKRPTVKVILSTLRAMLNEALDSRIIATNPCAGLGRKLKLNDAPESDVEEVKAFTAEQLTQFFEAAKHSPMPYGPLFWTLALTGMRSGEGVGLRWSDLDLERKSLHVQRTISGDFLSTPKSGRDRVVRLSETAARLLHKLSLTRVDRAKRFKWTSIPESIFTTRLGQPPSAYSVRVAFLDVLKRAGLPSHHSPHSLRHTFATLLLQNGESLQFVRQQLGRATIQLTADLYGRWAKAEPLQGGANPLDAMIPGQLVARTDSKTAPITRKSLETQEIRDRHAISSCSTGATGCTARPARTSSAAS
jgi:integrase